MPRSLSDDLQDLRDRGVRAVARRRQEGRREPAGHRRLRQLLLRLGHVVLDAGGRLVVEADARHEQRVGHRAVAEQLRLDQRLAVDRVRDSTPHVHVVPGLLVLVHEDVVGLGRREQLDLDAGLALELLDAREGRRLVDLRLAALDLQVAGVVVRDDLPGDAVEGGLAGVPVGRVLLELDLAALGPVVPDERAGADRRGVELVLGLAGVVLRQHGVAEVREVGQQRGPRVLRVDGDGVGSRAPARRRSRRRGTPSRRPWPAPCRARTSRRPTSCPGRC